MEATTLLLSSNISQAEFVLQNFSELCNLQKFKRILITSLAAANHPKTTLINITARPLFSISNWCSWTLLISDLYIVSTMWALLNYTVNTIYTNTNYSLSYCLFVPKGVISPTEYCSMSTSPTYVPVEANSQLRSMQGDVLLLEEQVHSLKNRARGRGLHITFYNKPKWY